MPLRYPRLQLVFSDTPSAPAAPAAAAGPVAVIEAPTRRLASVGVVVDIDQRTATVDGRELDLTFLEFELLAHLMAQPKRVMSRSQLMEAVWGRPNMGDTRTVSTHVARIRRKLGPAHRGTISTVRQIGYKFDPALGPR
ncbi:winged helix-turn-helix domain-containing protein [Kitasatospora kifunensis]|uniref:DNA-binding response OmpR family regulator n=1 Tax=Kitasatospora kifunensis TaxID=58351 RepID=A0A7W7VWQ2_KITKI|nr:winged helix-turn-helix domain-containing protein [Kitasatospora kifunensis]MBB4924929.1 DNA-binding response OmpR family regulator [Kitasatospora kifunensis]